MHRNFHLLVVYYLFRQNLSTANFDFSVTIRDSRSVKLVRFFYSKNVNNKFDGISYNLPGVFIPMLC